MLFQLLIISFTLFVVLLIKIKRLFQKKKSIIISIDGNIGSGKSTLVKILKETLDDIYILDEPVKDWVNNKTEDGSNILDLFYKDKKRWSYTFQNYAFITRMKDMINAKKKHNIIITERSHLSDKNIFAKMLYDGKYMNKLEYEIYNKWNHIFDDEIKIDKIIYLKTDPEICMKRIKKRNREEEKNVKLDYIEKVHKYHEDWLHIKNDDILVLDGNKDFVNNEKDKMIFLLKIEDFIKKNI